MPIINVWHRLSDPEALKRIPRKAGAYELANKYRIVIYIGHAKGDNLHRRIQDHTREYANDCILRNAVYFRYMVMRAYATGERTLFREFDHPDEVLFRVEEFKPFWQQIKELTGAPIKPEPSLLFECRKCELFEVCLGKDIENHIFEIPRLSQAKFGELTLTLSGVILSTYGISQSSRGTPLPLSKTNYFHPEQFNATSEPLRHSHLGYTLRTTPSTTGFRI